VNLRFFSAGGHYTRERLPVKLLYIRDGVWNLRRLLFRLLRWPFDVLVTIGMPWPESLVAAWAARIRARPYILMESHWYVPDTVTSRLLWPINLWLARHAAFVVTPGRRAHRFWLRAGIPSSRLRIVRYYTSLLNPKEEDRCRAAQIRSRMGGDFIILYLGRLVPKKGLQYLLGAFRQVVSSFPGARLMIAGEGSYAKTLVETAKSLGISPYVTFIGAVSEKEKVACFLACDVFCYPSITYVLPEEWPLAVIEAMSVGKPCVVTMATGSAPDLVTNRRRGCVVPEKDSAALAKALLALAQSTRDEKEMDAAFEALRAEYGYVSVADDFLMVLEEALRRT